MREECLDYEPRGVVPRRARPLVGVGPIREAGARPQGLIGVLSRDLAGQPRVLLAAGAAHNDTVVVAEQVDRVVLRRPRVGRVPNQTGNVARNWCPDRCKRSVGAVRLAEDGYLRTGREAEGGDDLRSLVGESEVDRLLCVDNGVRERSPVRRVSGRPPAEEVAIAERTDRASVVELLDDAVAVAM